MTKSEQQETTKAIVRAIGQLLKPHGFASSGRRQWRRTFGDAVQIVLMDFRRVGVHPYQIQILIDFESLGAQGYKNINLFGVGIELSRIVADPEGFLTALNPASSFGSAESRIERIRSDLLSTALPMLELIRDLPSLKQVKSRYPSQNDMNVVARIAAHLHRVSLN
jgi:hypothetical protein